MTREQSPRPFPVGHLPQGQAARRRGSGCTRTAPSWPAGPRARNWREEERHGVAGEGQSTPNLTGSGCSEMSVDIGGSGGI